LAVWVKRVQGSSSDFPKRGKHARPVLHPSERNPKSALTIRPSVVNGLLEVEPEGELYLAVGAEADRALDGLAQEAEGRAGGRLRVWPAGLEAGAEGEDGRRQPVRRGRVDGRERRQADVQGRGREGEVRLVEEVENLGAEFEPRRLAERDALVEDEVGLPKVGAAQGVARQVAELARRGDGEGGRVQEVAVVIEIRADARNQVRPAYVARGAAAGDVNDRNEAGGQRRGVVAGDVVVGVADG
jgi:hypothetical protein